MFPWRRDKDGKRRGFFDDFFTDFDEEFKHMEENMGRIFDEVAKSRAGGKTEPGKPYVYGFSMNIGPDGKPHVREFGNVGSKIKPTGEGGISEEREPLTDVIDREKEVTVIAEIPGVEKNDIKLKATKDLLDIKVDTAERKYHKGLKLPAEVKPDVSKATYKNGVLEVKLTKVEKKKQEKDKGVEIVIE